ncbi:MAG: hypothetical protein LBQ95_02430 [Lachnospiraceae bacterium]|jgi:formylmethanofuran dehydrogenase subunit C|nr:hypothetical protein [Lachnospiraceae bacterium]
MGAILTLKKYLSPFLDLEPLSHLTNSELNDIANARLRYGKNLVAAKEVFDIVKDIDKAPGVLTLRGNLEKAIFVGAHLSEGRIIVNSSVGFCAGKEMSGGELRILGDVGINSFEGMENGFAYVRGNITDGFGLSMRRGVVFVDGSVQGQICASMRGGTVIIKGDVTDDECNIGFGMSRGTIILTGLSSISGDFLAASNTDSTFLKYLFTQLKEHGIGVPDTWYQGKFLRMVGDREIAGIGEVFIYEGVAL